MVVKHLQPSYCSTSVYIKHLFETMSLLSNWLTDIVLHSDWIDHRMVGVIYMPQSLFEVNSHINYGICGRLPLKEIILLLLSSLYLLCCFNIGICCNNLLRHCFWVGRSPRKASPLLNRMGVPQSGVWGSQAQWPSELWCPQLKGKSRHLRRCEVSNSLHLQLSRRWFWWKSRLNRVYL